MKRLYLTFRVIGVVILLAARLPRRREGVQTR
jgi:hypothetical protein